MIRPYTRFDNSSVTTALVAKALGAPQLLALHMGLGSIVNFMLPVVYYLLLRSFRISIKLSILGAIGVLVFFLICGNTHRDWGNFTIVRSWQGKCVLMEIILPLALLYTMRFQLFGRGSDFIRIHAVTCCGIGLSSTGLFLVPFVIGITVIATIILTLWRRELMIRGMQSATILLQPLIVALLPLLGLLPEIGDISVYTEGWPLDITENLSLVFHEKSLPLYILYLIASFSIRPRLEFFAFLIYLVIAAIFLTVPIIGEMLRNTVTPGAYWRFSYAFFIPLIFGLSVSGLGRLIYSSKMRRTGIAMGFILIIATLAIKKSVLQDVVSMPSLKFNRSITNSINDISELATQNSVILAPENIAVPLGLFRPDIKFVVVRPSETEFTFAKAGQIVEGKERANIGVSLGACNFSQSAVINVRERWPQLRLVVYPQQCGVGSIRAAFSLDDRWQDFSSTEYHVLLHVEK